MHRALFLRTAPLPGRDGRSCIHHPDAQGIVSATRNLRYTSKCPSCIHHPDAQGIVPPLNTVEKALTVAVASTIPMHRALFLPPP